MKTIRCIAIDDEPIALEIISRFCERMGDIELLTFSEPDKGIQAVETVHPDIVFLDIEMNDVNGLQIARQLNEDICCIFTTAYMEYALDGFNLDAVDFLHKPFSYERFVKKKKKAVRRADYNRMTNEKKCIVVKQDYNNIPIRIKDIEYIEAMENYSKIHTSDGHMIVARNSLKSLYDQLEKTRFIRIHKSFIVPASAIKSYTRQNLQLVSGTTLPIGRQYADNLSRSIITL